MLQKMIKKKFLNPGAYIIFIKQLKDDGLMWNEIGEIMGTTSAYPQSVFRGQSNPKYNLVQKADVGFKEYFYTHEPYKRHLRKVVEVYETDDCVDWIETHEDITFLVNELGYSLSHFNNSITEKLKDKTIKFLAVSELTWVIDLWDNTSLGDFDLSQKQFYSAVMKGSVHGSQ